MEKIDKFLEFFIENLDDKRISVYKKMKYGHRYYYINFLVDDDPNQNSKNGIYQYRDNMEIVFDNRNLCIEVYGGDENNTLIIEDKNLLKKWSNILEEITSRNLEDKVINIFEKTLNECYNKNLYRELQMKKLFKEDESI
jgi:hypothetical protein